MFHIKQRTSGTSNHHICSWKILQRIQKRLDYLQWSECASVRKHRIWHVIWWRKRQWRKLDISFIIVIRASQTPFWWRISDRLILQNWRWRKYEWNHNTSRGQQGLVRKRRWRRWWIFRNYVCDLLNKLGVITGLQVGEKVGLVERRLNQRDNIGWNAMKNGGINIGNFLSFLALLLRLESPFSYSLR